MLRPSKIRGVYELAPNMDTTTKVLLTPYSLVSVRVVRGEADNSRVICV